MLIDIGASYNFVLINYAKLLQLLVLKTIDILVIIGIGEQVKVQGFAKGSP